MLIREILSNNFLLRMGMPFEYDAERRAGVIEHHANEPIAFPEPRWAVARYGVNNEVINFFIDDWTPCIPS